MPSKKTPASPIAASADVESVMEWLRTHATKATLDGMARYGIPSHNALGVAVKDIQKLGEIVGRNHDLAAALWKTNCYEARMLTSFIDEPERVTPAQMDRWCRDFDSWAICDTLCFHLFDRTPHAWAKVRQWSSKREEFEKRASFALLACLAGHDKEATDAQFVESFPLIEAAASDDRNFVKKALVWALRRIATRNANLLAASREVAERLAASTDASARWVGNTSLREMLSRSAKSTRPAKRRKEKPHD